MRRMIGGRQAMLVVWTARDMVRWLPYIGGLLSFHLILLLTLPRLVGALAVHTILGELVLAALLFYGAQWAVSKYARSAWMRGYATGHWDGLEDAGRDQDFF